MSDPFRVFTVPSTALAKVFWGRARLEILRQSSTARNYLVRANEACLPVSGLDIDYIARGPTLLDLEHLEYRLGKRSAE